MCLTSHVDATTENTNFGIKGPFLNRRDTFTIGSCGQLAGTVSGQAAFHKPVRPAALCRGETAENGKAERGEETELNGVEEGRDEMSDEEGGEIDGEEELAAPDWRVPSRRVKISREDPSSRWITSS